ARLAPCHRTRSPTNVRTASLSCSSSVDLPLLPAVPSLAFSDPSSSIKPQGIQTLLHAIPPQTGAAALHDLRSNMCDKPPVWVWSPHSTAWLAAETSPLCGASRCCTCGTSARYRASWPRTCAALAASAVGAKDDARSCSPHVK